MSASAKDLSEAVGGIPPEERAKHIRKAAASKPTSTASSGGPAEHLEHGPNGSHETTPEGETSTTSTNSPPQYIRKHPIPEDSILAEYRDYVREVSEACDGWIVAPILAVCGRLLTPGVWIDFAGWKPLTLFQFIGGPAGVRKSTTFFPAEAVAELLKADSFVTGDASDTALFRSFEAQPHRLQLEDEGNTILKTWANAKYGAIVAARYLKLYDGRPWGQNFRREAQENEDGKAERFIERATLSMCIGATFGVSRFDGIDAASGLRRRFGYYVATEAARTIDWPRGFGRQESEHFASRFDALRTLEGRIGEHNFTPAARDLWKRIQKENREQCRAIEGVSASDEAKGAALNESPSRILKLAVIFQACRWARNQSLEPTSIDAEVLELASIHQAACLEAAASLDTVGRKAAIADAAESLLARICTDFMDRTEKKGQIVLDKTTLTSKYCSHPNRPGVLTASRLYNELIPALIKQGRAKVHSRAGKLQRYAFRADE